MGAAALVVTSSALNLPYRRIEHAIDYLGAALGERRRGIFLASKTNDRTRDGSLRMLDDTLRRLRTDYLDLWQLHDLLTAE